MESIEYIIEKTENEGIMLLHIGSNKYYIGESLSIIFDSFIKGIGIDAIVENLNLITNSKKFNRELVTTIINEKIEPIIKNQNKVVKSSVKKIFRILDPIKFESFFQRFTFLFKKPIFYSILVVTFFVNLFFHFLFIKPDTTINNFQFPIILISIILIVLIHEIGHSIASFYYKITPKEIGFGLYFIFPALYTDLTETWKLKKESRIVINIAGIYFQLIVNLFLIAFLYTNFFNNYTIYIIILSSQLICLFNLNPFFKFDGYWIYSDYFNIPNLRKQTLDLYKGFITKNNKNNKKSLKTYAFLYLIFIIYIIYRIVIFIFKQHISMYKHVINNNTSNITIINWALFIFSFVLIYIIIKKTNIIYKTYFYENKTN